MNAHERAWRAEFPITERLVYLNNCSLTPLHRRGLAALGEYGRTWQELGGRAWFDHWLDVLDQVRGGFAAVLGADSGEVALEPAVSAALVSIASSFDYAKRPKVVVSDIDFPTDGHTWLALAARGVEVEFVRSPDRVGVPLELFERAVDDRTALVCTGHAYYTSGYIQDVRALAEICHRKGAALVVDAYQSIGAFSFDVHDSGVDFLVGGTLKWLMGGPGLGFVYARRDRIADARPTALGWWAMANPFDFDVEHLDLAPDARRFEYGTPAVAAVYTARAGLGLLRDVGVATVRERHMTLSQRLVEGALGQGWRVRCPIDPRRRTSIVTLEHPDPPAAVGSLRASGVICDYRPGLIRLSPHYFNTAVEMDQALALLEPLRAAPALA
ncbi:MAG TPA: aminotransferase class V-fold PLP-dependent enzyme [Candidatus Limnocylindria bacterium]|jgi:selenocysteine lyase/cysteine desulfurase|nr:aminotransferase class V-fold PLP-dependent enzyme [Candidatus Limnocylindria bacterium]